MRQRKFTFLLVVLLVALGLLFAGGEARANFTSFNYSMTGTFSSLDNTKGGFYTYVFASLGTSSATIKNILFEIPAEIPTLIPNTTLTVKYTPAGGTMVTLPSASITVFAPCIGDTDTRLGVDDCRFNVLKLNPPTGVTNFAKNFTIVLDVHNNPLAKIGEIIRLYSAKPQVVQLKSSQSATDASTANSPTPVDAPLDQPTATLAREGFFDFKSGDCDNLVWTSTKAVTVAISSSPAGTGGLVAENGIPTGGKVLVCPTVATIYTIKAIGTADPDARDPANRGPLTATAVVTINVGDAPPPDITISQTTVEKPLQNTNITFYSVNGVPACTCETPVGDPILKFPCDATNFNDLPCTKSSNTLDAPLLMCIPQMPGNPLFRACIVADGPNCKDLPEFITLSSGLKVTAKCDVVTFNTADTIIVIGQRSCEVGTYSCTIGTRASTCYGYHCH